jgi:hypothetical protein
MGLGVSTEFHMSYAYCRLVPDLALCKVLIVLSSVRSFHGKETGPLSLLIIIHSLPSITTP